MPSPSNLNTSGKVISNNAIASVGLSNTNKNYSISQKFRYQVLQVFEDGSISFQDKYQQYGKSKLGEITNNIAYPSSQGQQQLPIPGEYITLKTGPDPYSSTESGANPTSVLFWDSPHGSANIWNVENGDNKIIDKQTPGQQTTDPMDNINVENYNNSIIGI